MAQASQVIYLGDGAAWVWEIARTCFPQAAQILDYYHASQHLWAVAQALQSLGAGVVYACRRAQRSGFLVKGQPGIRGRYSTRVKSM